MKIYAPFLAFVYVVASSNTTASEDTKLNVKGNSTSTTTRSVADESHQRLLLAATTMTTTGAEGTAKAENGGHDRTPSTFDAAGGETSANSDEDRLPANPKDKLQNRYGTIVYASVFFSNGDLTPQTPYPKDPYNATFWSEGLNHLTNMGKVELYQLGMWLATRYRPLLKGGAYNSKLITIESGPNDYMFEGAACLAAGLFPPIGDQKWNQSLNWQPVLIQINTFEIHEASSVYNTCSKYDDEVNRISQLSVWQKYTRSYQNVFDTIGNGSGLSFQNNDIYGSMKTIFHLYLELTAEKNNNLSLPSWTSSVYPQPMETIAEKYLELISYSSVARKYKAGPLLQSIIQTMQNKVDGDLIENLHLYSGNVIGLSMLMNGWGVFNAQMPPTASALLVELRKNNTDYFITVSIMNGTEHSFLLAIPNCQPECLFHQFLNITANMTSKNWDDECNKIFVANIAYSTPLLVAGLIVLCVLFFLFALLFIKLCRCLTTKKGKLNYNK